ncbi:beta-galactosidase GalB [Paraflavitalea sp. CAU 1676]|uniref:beta-galactosidase GalB n=1 Tax=Paraflavitalea sp. CAU 1676 TaxID=3032598 RepID=UPI0023DC8B02|nr:beta-galactosidase GalB [Paraflavitalea sp. CAU 1676]MDF2191628.1 beta-galactosidase GalB [Paraflavitalea sp. CAU 1676]
MIASTYLLRLLPAALLLLLVGAGACFGQTPIGQSAALPVRERIRLNDGWRFIRYADTTDQLIYDERPVTGYRNDNIVADTRATESGRVVSSDRVLKPWILPTANVFIKDPAKRHHRPAGDPGRDFPFVQHDFNDRTWELVNLPHDWAINKPFYKEANAIVGGGMGRLPIQGVAWYRRALSVPAADKGKVIYLDIDGAMSYAMVWLNGHLVGGWPYGYNSFRLDLTPYVNYGGNNQLAIRIDNPAQSSRWYPGAGLYRSVWLTKVQPVHVAQWGSFVRTREVSAKSATIELDVEIANQASSAAALELATEIYTYDALKGRVGNKVGAFKRVPVQAAAGQRTKVSGSVVLQNPLLWKPLPAKKPALYVAVSRLYDGSKLIDEYETPFGVRSIVFDALKGMLVNGMPVRMQGVNQHHDLGALGGAFNVRAAERQLEMLAELGCNAIRLAHNPPAAELLDLCDRMGFLVIDEIFDCWEKGKNPLDFHLIFSDWYEADTRSFMRRDRNHPSVIAWSFGNEVGEQYTADSGAAVAKILYDIVKEEDPTRPATASMNYAKPQMPFPRVMDIISLNYQGEGIRDAPAYAHLKGIRTTPLYPAFQQQFPDKMIFSSETSSALSSRGTYIFPVTGGVSAPVSDSTGGDPRNQFVSAYELYTAAFGASPDKVFASQDKHPYVAGEFVWSGWDYLGEPTPYYGARSSYSGIIDLAGFKKDRFWLYQARWRPDLPIAHILPHWTWPNRVGQVTPVHVFSSGDEAELFVNGRSQGRRKRGAYEYRFRWDSVVYAPGVLKVVTYKRGKPWASETVRTAGAAVALQLVADRSSIKADGDDLAFITVRVTDAAGNIVPDAAHLIRFSVEGAGELVATDNGNAADLVSFASPERAAFSGLALAIVRAKKGAPGAIRIKAVADGLKVGSVVVQGVR